ncbi:uncharacterized protein LOC129249919 [Anastrepha obliqua]|uniref:uncharacterized protein LOC129249919 n=1 Tax=Anastrepha obliqua TaxID=95512 RepID=UPI00240A2309|nr:uncharacterized protein LOC129249919 [Anastrepha obliqua]
MRSFSNLTALLNLIGLSTIGQEFSRTLTSIAVSISLEHPVNTILYTSYRNKTADVLEVSHLLRALTTQLALPMLHLDSSPPIERYVRKFNTELLTIAQLNHQLKFDLELLKSLWQRLWRNRQSHLILLFDGSASVEYIELILKVCAKHRALNVIALQPIMAVLEGSYWTLRLFPIQTVVKRTFAADCKNIFPKHMENMYGHPIRIIMNSWHPQIYTYTPQKGNATLSGFLGRALAEYAYRHNATIECPISLNHKMFTYNDMMGFFVNKTIDIGSLTPIESGDRDLSFAVFFQWSNWCLMVPVEQPLSRSKFFYNIAHKTVKVLFCLSLVVISCIWALIARWQVKQELSLIDHVVNFSVLLGLLGMPFWTTKRASAVHKMICITISLVGVIIGTTYNTYLQSFSVNAPASNRITNIDDLLNSGIKVALRHEELCWVEDSIDFRKYIQNLTIFTNLTEFLLLRDTLDTRRAQCIVSI